MVVIGSVLVVYIGEARGGDSWRGVLQGMRRSAGYGRISAKSTSRLDCSYGGVAQP